MRKYILILLCFFVPISGIAQIAFDSNFENAKLDTAYLDSSSYRLWPITNLHFRISNAINQQPSFKIYDSLGYQLRSYHYMVYRYEGDSIWNFFDTAYKAGSFSDYYFMNQSAFTEDTVYISYWFPYTFSNLQNYLAGLQTSSYIDNFGTKTHSYQGRNIYGYEITDPNVADCYKKNVVITARQHPTEFINGYFVEGISNYLLYSTDSIADLVRKKFRFFIYPMLNPDGVVNGIGTNVLGQDINRSWEDSLILSNIPESDSIRPIIWNATNQKIDWSIDIHANAGNNLPYYWWGYTNASPVPVWQINASHNYVQSVSVSDSSGPLSQSLFQNYIQGSGVTTGKTAANWFRKSFNAIAFTFEPTTEPMGPLGDNRITMEKYRQAGASIIKGFAAVADTVQFMEGQIVQNTNQLIVTASGGYAPYTYSWTGPVNGNSDTLFNVSNGTYVIQVTDSLGCSWSDTIVFAVSGMGQSPPAEEKDLSLFPNPAMNICTIQLRKERGNLQVLVYNLHGNLLIKTNYEKDVDSITLDVSALSSGMYFIKVLNEEFFESSKLVVY